MPEVVGSRLGGRGERDNRGLVRLYDTKPKLEMFAIISTWEYLKRNIPH